MIQKNLQSVSVHERKIRRHFGDSTAFRSASFDRNLIIIAFTNRSGSNHLAEQMRLTNKFGGLHEFLNFDTVIRTSSDNGLATFEDYVAHLLRAHATSIGHFGTKASWEQLLMLLRFNVIAAFRSVHVIHVRRRSVIEQAVSFSIADQTKQWTSYQPASTAPPQFSLDDTINRMSGTALSDALIPIICELAMLNRKEVIYEDFAADMNPTMHGIAEFVGVDLEDWKQAEGKTLKQVSETKDEFIAKTRTELFRLATHDA